MGESIEVEAGDELGRQVFSLCVDIAAGESTRLELEFLPLGDVPRVLAVYLPPMADRAE